jgi:hypothetical protein
MPSNVCTAEVCRCKDGFPLYLANEGGGCWLFAGLARLAFGTLSRFAGPLVKLTADRSLLKVRSPGLAAPIAESEIARPRCVVLGCSPSCACFSTSSSTVFFGMKSQIEEPLDPLRIDGSGVLPLDTQTPSTSTPLSSALMPKRASSARHGASGSSHDVGLVLCAPSRPQLSICVVASVCVLVLRRPDISRRRYRSPGPA